MNAPASFSSGTPAANAATGTSESAELEQLTQSLQERLVNSGEWARLTKQLRKSLDKSDWEADLKSYARDQARERNGQIHLNELVALIEPQAKASIPQEQRDDILNKLRAFVQDNVED
ncbi:hypothetical protein P389DRAFT_207220 [Cystobasidium minutum MCA 4210]|uniref:uncharacterized protein n=1 Tax=Cystobasidium minutum MCA 4210 TaxID=1397322 RepID=UPI0034CF0974|eukprot:jgi/Rhomi1/207220/estExt_Genemark1.C_1_t10091